MSRAFSWLNFLALLLFASCMGLMEAAIVVYLRALGDVQGSELAQLHQLLHSLDARLLFIERQREAATLVMLLVPAFMFSERFGEGMPAFCCSYKIKVLR